MIFAIPGAMPPPGTASRFLLEDVIVPKGLEVGVGGEMARASAEAMLKGFDNSKWLWAIPVCSGVAICSETKRGCV